MRADHVVQREQGGRAQAGGDAERVEPQVAPDLRDAGQAAEAGRQSQPQSWSDRLPLPEPGPDRDERRGGVLEQQRDADRQPADRDEVQQGYREEAGQPVGQQGQVPARHAQPARADREAQHQQSGERPGGPHGGEL